MIGSTNSAHARDNTSTNPFNVGHVSAPIYLLDGTTRIADDNADLWDGTIDNPLNVTADGSAATIVSVATGSSASGTGSILGLTLGDASGPFIGDTGSTGFNWITGTFSGATNQYHFYALSDVLTVTAQINAPGQALLVIVTLLFVFIRRNWRSV